jgi:hypothetical protein
MPGVEDRPVQANACQPPAGHVNSPEERSAVLEERINEIAGALFDDPLSAFRAVRAYAERRIGEIEASRPRPRAEPVPAQPGKEPAANAAPPAPGRPEEFFQQERATYEAHKAELIKDEGRYVVIKGDEVAGVWPSYESALDGGYGRFGPVPFFVKQITAQ